MAVCQQTWSEFTLKDFQKEKKEEKKKVTLSVWQANVLSHNLSRLSVRHFAVAP